MARDPRLAVMAIGLILLMSTATLPSATPADGVWWWPTQVSWFEVEVLGPPDVHDPPFHLLFGAQVAIDGDTTLVSTQYDLYSDHWFSCHHLDSEDGCDWVYVFSRSAAGEWLPTEKLVPWGARAGDSFGYSLAVDDESGVLAIGNPGVDVQASEIHIFERDLEGAWHQTAKFNWSNPDAPKGVLGKSVTVSGTTVVTSGGMPGHVFVFDKVNGEWQQTATLDGYGGTEGLSLANDTLAVYTIDHSEGCAREDELHPVFQIYARTNGTWTLTTVLDPSDGHVGSATVGARLALNEDGNVLVIGAPIDRRVLHVPTQACIPLDDVGLAEQPLDWEPGAAGAVGSAWIYELVGDEWVMTADIPNPTPNLLGHVLGDSLFGVSVDASRDRVAIGAYCDLYNGGECSGAAFVYKRTAGQWLLEAKLRNNGSDQGDWLGHSVGISGDTVVAGADTSSREGSAHVFQRLTGPE